MTVLLTVVPGSKIKPINQTLVQLVKKVLEAEGRFPQRIKLTRCMSGYVTEEVEARTDARVAERAALRGTA